MFRKRYTYIALYYHIKNDTLITASGLIISYVSSRIVQIAYSVKYSEVRIIKPTPFKNYIGYQLGSESISKFY